MTLTDERPEADDDLDDGPSPLDRVHPPRTAARRRLVGAVIVVVVLLSGLAIPWSMGALPWVPGPPLKRAPVSCAPATSRIR